VSLDQVGALRYISRMSFGSSSADSSAAKPGCPYGRAVLRCDQRTTRRRPLRRTWSVGAAPPHTQAVVFCVKSPGRSEEFYLRLAPIREEKHGIKRFEKDRKNWRGCTFKNGAVLGRAKSVHRQVDTIAPGVPTAIFKEVLLR